MLALVVSYAGSTLIGPKLIPYLERLKFGQSIRQEGPKSHYKKAGTPTMGGFIFLVGLVLAMLLVRTFNQTALFMLFSIFGFGSLGFLDDYIKVVLKRNLGLRAWQKLAGQFIVSTILAIWGANLFGTELIIPFVKTTIDIGVFYYPFVIFVAIATTNAVNLTDGLDGLAGSVTTLVVGFFGLVAVSQQNVTLLVIAVGLIGGLGGFLKYNRYPAQVFMGDLGSLALGGAVAGFAFASGMALMIPIVGGIYFAETLSVIIQVVSFKTRGKRVFKMSPLHHHYELSGWSETKIVGTFYLVTLGLVIAGYFIAI